MGQLRPIFKGFQNGKRPFKLSQALEVINQHQFEKIPLLYHFLNNSIQHQKKYNVNSIETALSPHIRFMPIYKLLIEHHCEKGRWDYAVDLYLRSVAPLSLPVEGSSEKIIEDMESNTEIAQVLFQKIPSSSSFATLLKLRLLWENFFFPNAVKRVLEVQYFASFIAILNSTASLQQAFELFMTSFISLTQNDNIDLNHDPELVLSVFPTHTILNLLVFQRSFDKALQLLEIIQNLPNKGIPGLWKDEQAKYVHMHALMSSALDSNNYEMVCFMYDHILKTHGGIDTFDILKSNIPTEIASLDSSIIFSILQTFSTHGDVHRTLELVELYFVHRGLQGNKAINIDICSQIVQSYCYNDQQTEWDGDVKSMRALKQREFQESREQDHSIEIILDVLDGFIKKSGKLSNDLQYLSYMDVTNSLSYKFLNFVVLDANVMRRDVLLTAQDESLSKLDPNFNESLPEDFVNHLLEISKRGNVLANLETLEKFVEHHMIYLNKIKANDKTYTIFINCLLNHINIYQNVTGITKLLSTLHRIDPLLVNGKLDNDLYDIILEAMSKSRNSVLVSLQVFKFLHSNNKKISISKYLKFIKSALNCNAIKVVEYYLYHFLADYGEINRDLRSQLQNSNLAGLQKLKESLHMIDKDNYALIYKENQLCLEESDIGIESLIELKGFYSKEIDERDAKYIQYVFNQ